MKVVPHLHVVEKVSARTLPPLLADAAFNPKKSYSSSLKKKKPFVFRIKSHYIESRKSQTLWFFVLPDFFSLKKLQSLFKTAFPLNIIHSLRRIVSPETPCIDEFVPDFRGKTLVLPGAGGRDVGDFDGQTGGGWTCGKPLPFFLRFFLWCFFVGGGEEKKRMETQLFWEEEPHTFLVFFCFFGPF